ncbi:hypothetical protein [Microbacterium imperiale]|nr:hypothetical protein [Microbacterium imperiale]
MTEWYLFGSRFAETVTFAVAGAAVGLLPWFLDKRKLHVEDYELWIDVLSASMKSPSAGSELAPLEYSVNGTPVRDPHRVELCMWVTGKRDFTPERFNQRAFAIDLGVPIVSELEEPVKHELAETKISLTEQGLIVRPSIMRRQAAVRWMLVTDGKPTVSWNRPFHDVTIASWFESWAQPAPSRVWKKVAGIFLLPLAIILPLSMGLLAGPLGIPLGPGALVASIGGVTSLVVGMKLLVASDSPGRRLARVRSELRRRVPGSLVWERYEHTGDVLADPRVPYRRRVKAAAYPDEQMPQT